MPHKKRRATLMMPQKSHPKLRKDPKPADERPHIPYQKKPGHYAIKYDDEMKGKAEYCGMMGFTLREMGDFLQISTETIRKYRGQYPEFDLAIRRGFLMANATVTKKIFEKATKDGHWAAMRWWAEKRISWAKEGRVPLIGGDLILPGGSKTSIQAVVTDVVEIVQRRVKDRDVLRLIAQDLRDMGDRRTTEEIKDDEAKDEDNQ